MDEKPQEIEETVQRASELITQLLGYVREGGYEVSRIAVNQIIEETLETSGPINKKIRIHPEYADNLLGVMADEKQIRQVFLNLYLNALDAMPHGGDLFIQTRNVTHKHMTGTPSNPKPGNYVMLTVRDTGVGMAKAPPEQPIDLIVKDVKRAIGLGLAYVFVIVKAQGGYIHMESAKGEGTIVKIYLRSCDTEMEDDESTPTQFLKVKSVRTTEKADLLLSKLPLEIPKKKNHTRRNDRYQDI